MSNPTPRRDMNITPRKLQLIALAMSLYLFLIVWPATDFIRLYYADDPDAFSGRRLLTALASAIAFGCYAQWQMRRLVFRKIAPSK